jgi:glycosyltransferase involved in cell wall biosynthesis
VTAFAACFDFNGPETAKPFPLTQGGFMRIALVSPLFESVPPKFYGGTERVVHALSRGLTDRGHEVTVFASGDSSVGCRLVSVIEEALRLTKKPVQDPCAYNLKMLGQIARVADEFDVIHNHHDYWMLPLSQMTRTPMVTTLHGRLDVGDAPLALRAFPEAHYVSISNHQRRPLPDIKWLRTIYHGMEMSHLKAGLGRGNYLAFLGRITREKRPEYAIQIAKKSGMPLKIAAKIEGPESQAYYDTFVKPHVDGKFIEFVGEISEAEKSEFLGDAHALVFPIDWPEPFGLVVIEALACGTPVLARPFGAVPEITQDGITGYSAADIGELSRRVKDISTMDRKGCRRWVEERFSIQRMTKDYIHVYQHLEDYKNARVHRHRRDFLYPVERAVNGNS